MPSNATMFKKLRTPAAFNHMNACNVQGPASGAETLATNGFPTMPAAKVRACRLGRIPHLRLEPLTSESSLRPWLRVDAATPGALSQVQRAPVAPLCHTRHSPHNSATRATRCAPHMHHFLRPHCRGPTLPRPEGRPQCPPHIGPTDTNTVTLKYTHCLSRDRCRPARGPSGGPAARPTAGRGCPERLSGRGPARRRGPGGRGRGTRRSPKRPATSTLR